MSRSRRSPRRLVVAVLVAALVPVVALPGVGPASASGGFGDIPENAFYASPVDWLAEQAITTGTAPGRFSPDDVVTRAQMATFLFRYSQEPAPATSSPFSDVPTGAWFSDAVAWLAASGVTTGTSQTTFSPHDPVTRAQMATFLWRFRGSQPAVPSPFSDVPAGRFYTEAVGWLASSGITTGTTPTTLSPDDAVSRAQMATFLWRLAGEPESSEPGTNRVGDDVTVADAGDFAMTNLDLAGTSILQWVAGDVPPVGQVVAVGITDQTPEGFLGRVVAVSGDTITTEPISLFAVVPDVDISIDLDEIARDTPDGDIGSAGLRQAGLFDEFFDADIECGPDLTPFEYTAGLNLDSDAHLEASWGVGKPTRVVAGFDVTASVTASAKAVAAVDCTKQAALFDRRFTPVYFQLGALPVVIVPRLKIDAVVTAGFAGAIEANWTYTATLSTGLEYLDGNWTPSYDTTGDSTFSNHNLSAVGEAKLSLIPAFSLDLYGVAGPYVSADLSFGAKVQTGEPRWEVGGELSAQIGAAVDVLFAEFKVDLQKVVLAAFVIARADAEAWVATLPGQVLDIAARHVDNAGAYVVTRAPSAVHSYDRDGQQRWSTPLVDGVGSAVAVASTSDGMIVAYGITSGSLSIVRFDDEGDEIWRRTEEGSGFHEVDVAVAVDGTVFITARRHLEAPSPGERDDARAIVRVLDADGNPGALVEFDLGSLARGIAAGPGGGFYVKWEQASESSATSIITRLQRRTAGGALVWDESFISTGPYISNANQYLSLAAEGDDVYLPLVDETVLVRDIATSVRRFRASGDPAGFSRPDTNGPSFFGPLVAVDTNGDVIEFHVDLGSQRLLRYSAAGDLKSSEDLDLPFFPFHLDVEDGGSVYLAGGQSAARVSLPLTS